MMELPERGIGWCVWTELTLMASSIQAEFMNFWHELPGSSGNQRRWVSRRLLLARIIEPTSKLDILVKPVHAVGPTFG